MLLLEQHQGGLTDSFGTYCLFMYCLYNGTINNIDCGIQSIDELNNELERMWKEMVMVQFKLLVWNFPGGRKNIKLI